MPKVKVGDINIYYEVHGKGEPLVMICGHGANTELYSGFIPVYSREYRLVLFDNRGAGKSDAPDIPYTIEKMADDMSGLLDAIGIRSAHIWGASMGGMIAQQFALRYPERVRSLILACTCCGGPLGKLSDESIKFMKQRKNMNPKEMVEEMLRLSITQEFAEKNPELIQNIISVFLEHPTPTQGQTRQEQAIIKHNTYKRLSEIKAPTLILHGEADKSISAKNAQILAHRIPNAQLLIFANTGHMLLEALDELNKTTLDFLRRHRAG
ncbi:MAG: hypothetical protein A2Z29_06365 [Chloroflexi bacterium RBG_16_56_11]|nr:MAG: hypothetical protein A2Z29_06365 [Chloroflexi bacterium RBG_16_56_11]